MVDRPVPLPDRVRLLATVLLAALLCQGLLPHGHLVAEGQDGQRIDAPAGADPGVALAHPAGECLACRAASPLRAGILATRVTATPPSDLLRARPQPLERSPASTPWARSAPPRAPPA